MRWHCSWVTCEGLGWALSRQMTFPHPCFSCLLQSHGEAMRVRTRTWESFHQELHVPCLPCSTPSARAGDTLPEMTPAPPSRSWVSRLAGEKHPARQGYPRLCPQLLDCCTSVLNMLPSHLTRCDLGTVQLKMKRSQPRGKPPRRLCWGAPPAARDLTLPSEWGCEVSNPDFYLASTIIMSRLNNLPLSSG